MPLQIRCCSEQARLHILPNPNPVVIARKTALTQKLSPSQRSATDRRRNVLHPPHTFQNEFLFVFLHWCFKVTLVDHCIPLFFYWAFLVVRRCFFPFVSCVYCNLLLRSLPFIYETKFTGGRPYFYAQHRRVARDALLLREPLVVQLKFTARLFSISLRRKGLKDSCLFLTVLSASQYWFCTLHMRTFAAEGSPVFWRSQVLQKILSLHTHSGNSDIYTSLVIALFSSGMWVSARDVWSLQDSFSKLLISKLRFWRDCTFLDPAEKWAPQTSLLFRFALCSITVEMETCHPRNYAFTTTCQVVLPPLFYWYWFCEFDQ